MDLFSINKIDIDTLRSMEGLLSKSVGYPTSIDDEVDYFIHESPSGWLIARDQKTQKIGFIRSFEQNQEWSLGELYVEPFVPNRKELAAKLIAQFLEINSFSPGHRLRFDFSSADVELNSAIQAAPKRSKRQRFLYFELQPSNVPTVAQSTIKEKPTAVEIAWPQQRKSISMQARPRLIESQLIPNLLDRDMPKGSFRKYVVS